MIAPAPKPRPAAAQRREAILLVAQEVFLEHGFEGASMSQVAARLGGSKGTLYSYFDSKEALFEALVADSCARNADAMFAVADDADIEARLLGFARGYIRLVNSDWAIRMFQAVAAEARRRPEIGRLFFDAGPGNALARLAAWIAAAAAAGEIAVTDPQASAEDFASLCRGSLHLKRMLALAPEPDAARIDSLANHAVTQFLHLHAAGHH
ncbi:TetR/AcrR family transcriptional regulator [Sandarakinorhabdus sp. DWP1-3-1]|uniref:TetR/AcrR family transcriptional regulator n=1 Tax=Sandarakinorhabdus sp. DWP1-3-1 TaxID=2804627 RepID=UPI003CEE2180